MTDMAKLAWWALGSLLLGACGHKAATANTVPNQMLDPGGHDNDPNEHVTTAPPADPVTTITAEKACERIAVLMGDGCAWSKRFPPEMSETSVCMRSMEQWFAPATEGHDQLQKIASCWTQECDEAEACMVRAQSAAPPPPPRKCGTEGTGMVYFDKATWAKRNGVNITRFADTHTSEQAPIEVCGIDGEVAWMTRATCNGGSHPFATAESANERRDGWVKTGGRCNSILDRYTVACPEATYTVHVDRYVCAEP